MGFYEDMMGLYDSDEEKKVVKKPLFNYAGSKWRSVKEIIDILPVRGGYVEPFGGTGVIMLNRDPSKLEVFNDRNSGITDFYRCIQDPKLRDELIERLRLVPNSRELWQEYRGEWENLSGLERAVRWYYVIMNSFSAQGRNWGRVVTPGMSTTIKKVWAALPRFHEVHTRFKGVQIENGSFGQIMSDFNHEDTVMYLDPPYVSTSQAMYKHKMDMSMFEDLKRRIQECKGFVALSCYDQCVPYWKDLGWDDSHDWEVIIGTSSTAGNAGNNKKGLEKRTTNREVLLWKEN